MPKTNPTQAADELIAQLGTKGEEVKLPLLPAVLDLEKEKDALLVNFQISDHSFIVAINRITKEVCYKTIDSFTGQIRLIWKPFSELSTKHRLKVRDALDRHNPIKQALSTIF